ncbi:hypothetical protein AC1031_014843 [Aphanomyces cochlioides]|nr:hypothetical protein AC1031_014843 [Aphanomyces cochlioides]
MRSIHAAIATTVLSLSCAWELQLHRDHTTEVSVKRNLQTNERMLRLDDGRFKVVPLNLGMGTHYTWIYAGSPPQRASIIIDTGSHQTAFPCKGCDGCGTHTDAPFDVAASSSLTYPTCDSVTGELGVKCTSCTEDKCLVGQMYSEGSSWKAMMVEDDVWLGDAELDRNESHPLSTRYKFGCQVVETGLFTTQVADGIMGISNRARNIVKKLFQEDKIDSNVFSLCFTPKGGSMSVGTPLTSRHKEDLTYAKVSFDKTGWYAVEMREIRIGGVPIEIESTQILNGGRKVIVDSGTTASYLPDVFADEFNNAFKLAVGKKYMTSGAGYTEAQVANLPTIEFVMTGVDGKDVVLTIPPEQYLKKKEDRYFSTIHLEEAAGGIIGADLMMHHDFVFDADRFRVGFAKADCDYSGSSSADPVAKSVEEAARPALDIDETESDDNYPMILTLGGVSIGIVFVVGIIIAVYRSKDARWTQVNLEEFDEDSELVDENGKSKSESEAEKKKDQPYDAPPDVDDEFFNAQHEEVIDGVDKATLHRMEV